jgi:hypothetical protein
MKDPNRLLEQAGSLDAHLLAALDEPAPPDLLAHTLATVGAASVMPTALSTAAPGATAGASAAKVAGVGLLGATGVSALAGLITVGALKVMLAHERSPRDTRPLTSPPAASVQAPPPITAASAPVIAPSPSVDTPAPSAGVRFVARTEENAAPAPSASAPAAKTPHATLAAEIALIDEARRALQGGDAARAKALMDRYAREIRRGQLAREAALLRAQALDAASRTNP